MKSAQLQIHEQVFDEQVFESVVKCENPAIGSHLVKGGWGRTTRESQKLYRLCDCQICPIDMSIGIIKNG